jgi:hypothetical protein
MMLQQKKDPRIVKISVRFYGWLLRLGPKEFQQEYAEEVLKDFRRYCHSAYTQGGIYSVLRLWPLMFASAIVDMGAEQFSEAVRREKRRSSMQRQTSNIQPQTSHTTSSPSEPSAELLKDVEEHLQREREIYRKMEDEVRKMEILYLKKMEENLRNNSS